MAAVKPPREIVRWSGQKRDGRPTPITIVAIHESVGITDAWDLALFCERKGVSYHDLCDLTQIIHTVRFSDTAWHLRNGNPDAVGLCLTTPVNGYSRTEWLGSQVKKVEYAAWWVARTCKSLGIPIRHLDHRQIRSALTGNKADAGVCTHNDYTLATNDGTHTDPRNFPTDVCIEWANGILQGQPEDDMAAVPQSEWNQVRDRIATMYGDRGPNDRQTSRRVDNGFVRERVPIEVWDFLIENYVGNNVAARQILVAIEKRLNDQGLAILELLKRTGGVPEQWKTITGSSE